MSKKSINFNHMELTRMVISDGWFVQRSNKHVIYAHPVKKGTIVLPSKHGNYVSPALIKQTLKLIG